MSGRRNGNHLPPFFFMIFFIVLLVLVSFVLWEWTQTMDFTNQTLEQRSHARHISASQTVIERARILTAAKTSAFHHARILGSYLHGNSTLSLLTLQTKMSSYLFLAISTIPYISQVSVIGKDGISYSYRKEGGRILGVYSNTTDRIWYKQLVDANTGVAYGDPIQSKQQPLNISDWAEKDGFLSKAGLFIFVAPFPKPNSTEEGSQIGGVAFGVSLDFFADYVLGNLSLRDGGGGGGGEYLLATADGQILAHRDSSGNLDNNNNNKVVIANSSCELRGDFSNFQRQRYEIYCSPITTTAAAAGIKLVSVIPAPLKGEMEHFRKMRVAALTVLVAVLIIVAFGSCIMIQFTRIHQNREMFLSSSLIRQLEATQQAERKSMNKSLAFANASHDVRTSLAGITGLIDICRSEEATPNSELNKNLDQMMICSAKLLDILNSVLDISKVEAGKMQLDEIEFDMADVIEESVDIFHVVGLRKKLEVIWDPCDCSILRATRVKGDVRRFKQIVDNLLGNAVKFTSSGHVVLRGWAKRRSSLQNSKAKSGNNQCPPRDILPDLLFCCKNKRRSSALTRSSSTTTTTTTSHSNTNDGIEFVFEVDDTGVGIPKEKRASVFENYVQVKESSRFEGGTGLGLGIVQSYVRLMGGEIGIVDKKMNEKGTCFRFNIFLKSVEKTMIINGAAAAEEEEEEEAQEEAQDSMEISRFATTSSVKGIRKDGVHINALVFVQGEETRRISQSWMESFGIKVLDVINTSEQFTQTLEKYSSSYTMNQGFSEISDGEEIRQSPPCMLRESFSRNNRTMMTHLLIIVEVSQGLIKTSSTALWNFARNVRRNQYRIAWLVDADTSTETTMFLKDGRTPCDVILRKPFHGSRLCQVLRIVREFGEKSTLGHTMISNNNNNNKSSISCSFQASSSPPAEDKILMGSNVLVVEDTKTLQRVASRLLSRLGANVTIAENGERAVSLVEEAFAKIEGQDETQTLKNFPYKLILMDCEMPVMNGYEATMKIRAGEMRFGIHIPIIATSAHEWEEHGHKSIEAGMDFHITKPLQKDKLLNVVRNIHGLFPVFLEI